MNKQSFIKDLSKEAPILDLSQFKGHKVEITVSLIDLETEDEKSFQSFAIEEFAKGYSEKDSIYDNYPIDKIIRNEQ